MHLYSYHYPISQIHPQNHLLHVILTLNWSKTCEMWFMDPSLGNYIPAHFFGGGGPRHFDNLLGLSRRQRSPPPPGTIYHTVYMVPPYHLPCHFLSIYCAVFGPPGQIPPYRPQWALLTIYTWNPPPNPSHKWRGDHPQLPWTIRGGGGTLLVWQIRACINRGLIRFTVYMYSNLFGCNHPHPGQVHH
jgi:hypothetical protein